ncbi:hypothetical protein ACHAXN_000001 [Cyclotella atomus]
MSVCSTMAMSSSLCMLTTVSLLVTMMMSSLKLLGISNKRAWLSRTKDIQLTTLEYRLRSTRTVPTNSLREHS